MIGNNDYAHLPKLKNAVQDARDVADVLERLYGFEVQTIENASRSDIIGALVKLRAKLTWDNNLLIYYAGHGTIDDYTSRGYWQPVEAKEEDLTNWVPNSTITDMLRAIRAKHIMVVADSCYSGTLVRSAQGGFVQPKSGMSGCNVYHKNALGRLWYLAVSSRSWMAVAERTLFLLKPFWMCFGITKASSMVPHSLTV